MSSVPFIVDLGLSTVQGILRLEDDGVAIDWRPYTMLDEPAGELSTLVIPYGQLESAEYGKRVGRGRITLTSRSAAAFKGFPLPNGSIATLAATIKRANRSAAELWCAETTLRIAERSDT